MSVKGCAEERGLVCSPAGLCAALGCFCLGQVQLCLLACCCCALFAMRWQNVMLVKGLPANLENWRIWLAIWIGSRAAVLSCLPCCAALPGGSWAGLCPLACCCANTESRWRSGMLARGVLRAHQGVGESG